MRYFDIKSRPIKSQPDILLNNQKSTHIKKKTWWKFLFLSLAILFLILGGLAAYFGQNVKSIKDPLAVQKYQDFNLNPQENCITVGKNLKEQGLIKSWPALVFYIVFSGEKNKLQPGVYYLSPSMRTGQIGFYLLTGRTKDRRITIPEGWRLTEIAKKLEEAGLIKYDEFMNLVSDNSLLIKKYTFFFDKPKDASLEGYIFPDTYQFDKDSTPQEIVEEMLNNFDRKVDIQLRSQIKSVNQKLFDVLIIASIVEREAKLDEDRPKIASVFYNRLKLGMKLEADPTIQYAKSSWKPISASDYQLVDSPYNTYQINGLPPGPICNPGLKSIQAAISPAQTDYLYFFHLSDGTTIYSKTVQEHEANRAKYGL